MKFLCEHCKAKYQIADEKVAGRTVRMKCRKCGGSIEVRAAVTETSVSLRAGEVAGSGSENDASERPKKPSAVPPRGPTPRASPIASNLSQPSRSPTAPRPATTGSAPAQGNLASAFQKNVTHGDEQGGAGLDLRELSAADEWYVAVNGVPVGPVRVGEVRRKAAMGAVTEDSLCWQEGMEEWRAVRTVTELAAVVREAASGGRTSQVPAEPRAPGPAQRPAPPRRPTPLGGGPKAGTSPRPAVAAAAMQPLDPVEEDAATIVGRSPLLDALPPEDARPARNGSHHAAHAPAMGGDPFKPAVAPFAALAPAATPFGAGPSPSPFGGAGPGPVAPSPFGPRGLSPEGGGGGAPFGSPFAPSQLGVPTVPGQFAPSAAPPPIVVAPSRRMSPIVVGMIVMFAAFGLMAAYLLLAPKPQVVVVHDPAAPAPPPTSATPIPTDVPPPTAVTAPTAATAATPDAAVKVASATPSHPGAPSQPGTKPPPGAIADPALRALIESQGRAPRRVVRRQVEAEGGGGAQLTEAETQQVVSRYSLGIKRECWDRSSSTTPSVNETVDIVINGTGQVTSATATGNDPVVGHCLEEAIRRWRWPGGGEVKVPFKFLRQ